MTLPTFLGIGVSRGGTTWLHKLLASHPDVYVPAQRKELRFFDRDHDLGLDHYRSFFPPPELSKRYRAIGEISPQYYRCDNCPERIFRTLPESKLILILRHPVDRAYSHYGFYVQRRNFKGSFEDFLRAYPKAIEHGYYGRLIGRYRPYFDRSAFLILLFEEAVTDVPKTKNTLAKFLDIDVDQFPASAGTKKANASSLPRAQFLYALAARTARQLRKWRLESTIDFVRHFGIDRWLAIGKPLPPLNGALRLELSQIYQDDFVELERNWQLDLSSWKQSGS